MKKFSTGVLILLFTFLIKLPNVDAACSVSISAPSSAVVGNTFKVVSTVSSDVGGWDYILSYDSSKVKLISGSLHVVGVIGDSRSSSYTFKALTSGSTSFKIVNTDLASGNSSCAAKTGVANITMKTQAEIEAGYSRNNNLASLSVNNGTLSPSFDANKLEYSVTLPVDTKKAFINAKAADTKATVTGAGEVSVEDGLNKVEVIVTAQHGEKKTYVINITVEELNPIEVNYDGKKYTVVRKSSMIDNVPSNFEETKVKIEGQEIVAYQNKASKIVLVGLKDKKGKVELFIYENNKFKKFNNVLSQSKNLIIIDDEKIEIPLGYKKTKINYNEKELTCYKNKYENKNLYLVYALNLETGKKDLYLFDKEEGTFLKYDNSKDKIIEYISLGLFILIGLILLKLIFKMLKKIFTSKEKKINKLKKKIDRLNKKEIDYDLENEEEPVITKIKEDDYNVPKKTRKDKRKELLDAKKLLDKDKTSVRHISLEPDDMDDYGDF